MVLEEAVRASFVPLNYPLTTGVLERPRLKAREIYACDQLGAGTPKPAAIRKVFGDLWWPETDRGWVSTISDNAYRWTNAERRPDDRRWIQFSPPDAHLTAAPVSVEILIEDGAASYGAGAGLLYRYQSGKTRYDSFLLTPDEQLRFAFTDPDGEKTLYKSRSDAVRSGGFNKLGIASRGAEFFLFVTSSMSERSWMRSCRAAVRDRRQWRGSVRF